MSGGRVDAEFGAADGCAERVKGVNVVEGAEIGNFAGGEAEGDVEEAPVVERCQADQAAVGRTGNAADRTLDGELLRRGPILHAAAVGHGVSGDRHRYFAISEDPERARVDVIAVDVVAK